MQHVTLHVKGQDIEHVSSTVTIARELRVQDLRQRMIDKTGKTFIQTFIMLISQLIRFLILQSMLRWSHLFEYEQDAHVHEPLSYYQGLPTEGTWGKPLWI